MESKSKSKVGPEATQVVCWAKDTEVIFRCENVEKGKNKDPIPRSWAHFWDSRRAEDIDHLNDMLKYVVCQEKAMFKSHFIKKLLGDKHNKNEKGWSEDHIQ